MTTEGNTENESRYRGFKGAVISGNKTFRHQTISALDVSEPRRFEPRRMGITEACTFRQQYKTVQFSCSKSEIRHTYTNVNGPTRANIIHVTEILYSIHPSINPSVHPSVYPSCVKIFWCRNVLVPKHLGVFRGLVPNRHVAESSGAEISSYQNDLVLKSQ